MSLPGLASCLPAVLAFCPMPRPLRPHPWLPTLAPATWIRCPPHHTLGPRSFWMHLLDIVAWGPQLPVLTRLAWPPAKRGGFECLQHGFQHTARDSPHKLLPFITASLGTRWEPAIPALTPDLQAQNPAVSFQLSALAPPTRVQTGSGLILTKPRSTLVLGEGCGTISPSGEARALSATSHGLLDTVLSKEHLVCAC